jgi:hypothetical protein
LRVPSYQISGSGFLLRRWKMDGSRGLFILDRPPAECVRRPGI